MSKLSLPQIEWVMRIDAQEGCPIAGLDSLIGLGPLDIAALKSAGLDDVPKLQAHLASGKGLLEVKGFGDRRAAKVEAAVAEFVEPPVPEPGVLPQSAVAVEIVRATELYAQIRHNRPNGRSDQDGWCVVNPWLEVDGRVYARIRWHCDMVSVDHLILAALQKADPRFHRLTNSALPIQECYGEPKA